MVWLLKTLSLIVLLFASAGCNSLMTEVTSQEVRPPAPDKVKVVFMRPGSFFERWIVGTAVAADLCEVIDGNLKFIGNLGMRDKIVYETTPGQEKVFMVTFMGAGGTVGDFMLGKLAGGRIYYSIVVSPSDMRPIRANPNDGKVSVANPDFASWVKDTRLRAPTAESTDRFSREKDRFQDLYKDLWARFQRKTPAEKAERTLNPEDGVLK